MTSDRVNSFVGDLVQMAQAMERLPQVEHELNAYKRGNEVLHQAVADREESILKLKAEIEAHLATIRKVEAERDDAELRFLDSEDRTKSALSFIKATFGSAGSLIQALEPPAPTPVAVPADAQPEMKAIDNPLYGDPQEPMQPQDQSEPLPSSPEQSNVSASVDSGTTTQQPMPEPGPMGIDFHGDASNVDSVSSGPSGEREAHPTNDTAHTDPVASVPTVSTSTDAPTQQTLSSPTEDDVGYHNEPKIDNGWHDWDQWALRMNNRYGIGTWPQRDRNHNFG